MSESSLVLCPAARLNRLWRLMMTGICFAMFGVGGLLLSLVWFNVLLIQRDTTRRRQLARRSISASFRLFLCSARRLGVLDYRIDGIETLQRDRGCLIIANHPTLIDYVLLASVMPDADCLVKADLQKNFFFRGVIRSADYLLNSQSDALLPDCQQRLDNGDAIIIFPEGTRTRYGEPLVLQRGAANIAVRCGCDLRVVHICCSQDTLGKQSRWYHIPPEKPYFTVSVRERISSDIFMAPEEARSLAARRLNRLLQQSLTPES
ncbi:1-acyl-sn-glycerol-3-phosphate acyltransferase [Pectobacterium parmentieri]|uniref:1-acyl-sn-glycerol-3-phosphate acyltransferase n=1 Tax=Pectobacterium parmentieri TaxID=1905730 RepID=A0A8B3FIR1_PECPM|nr:lysophospholipid acyltransferase family protein [Pectobacterium parmentieri]ACX90256.1 phospholipid/glycerol acyltransferase [Pectobacterium parmentieri WPP163]AOR60886.1 acyl-phosphate glycerol 3-phosphate acyltransferase [Pectobacterium parmentieri]AYH03634.1 1-acyl-sn-glycerol-3-phosphate acyltransferase [Pectobacterium parmentieri]AYH07969.1 1-acyl-sn-glycerol-3-phosphate acyltransferase [Pectobacterium parmentieri]AYH12441.1 1-acyl-sn-glycerol-3-phosphate acyltransferase [Pectobacteriu